MRRKLAAGILCALLVFQMTVMPPARAASYVYFVAAGENILPLSDETMPFWSGGYLYIASSIFTGGVREALDISCARNSNQKRVVLYSREKAESLWFEWEKSYATDKEGNTYYPGAIYKNGEVFVPASLVAKVFGLQYSVTKVQFQADGETVQGDLVWLRAPGHILSDRVFADAASSGAIIDRYTDYLKGKKEQTSETTTPGEPEGSVEVEGISIYLCLTAGDYTEELLNQLDQYGAQAAFFCTPEFLEEEGDLLRRMTATGQSIGILADAEDPERTAVEQLEAGNRALDRATCGKTRLAWIQNGGEQDRRAAREAGYRCLEPDLDRSSYQLQGVTSANSLLRSVSSRRDDVTVWLADTADAVGLRAFLAAAENAEGQCLAWTETA